MARELKAEESNIIDCPETELRDRIEDLLQQVTSNPRTVIRIISSRGDMVACLAGKEMVPTANRVVKLSPVQIEVLKFAAKEGKPFKISEILGTITSSNQVFKLMHNLVRQGLLNFTLEASELAWAEGRCRPARIFSLTQDGINAIKQIEHLEGGSRFSFSKYSGCHLISI